MHMTAHNLPATAGNHDLRARLALDGEPSEVPVSLHVPDTPQGAPLVIVLHYGGPPVGYYGRGLLEQLVLPAWRDLGAVYAAPVLRGDAWQSLDNKAAVRALVAACHAHYGTDSRSCYLVGYSLGAIGAWHWLAERTHPFSAVVPVAGRVPDDLARFDTPTYALHSTADRLFPSDAVIARCEALRAAGSPLHWRVLDGIDHFNVGGYRHALAALVDSLPGRPAQR
ncbi:MAG: hypothetical protein AB7O21_00920 [Gammaproteobacteria bacterium]